MKQEIEKALEVLKSGGVILYPTDTVWGLGCDATNENAVEKIKNIKKRLDAQSFIVLVDNDNRLASYVQEVPELAYDLIEFAENPLTIIYSGAKNLAKNVIAQDGSVGIRVVKHAFCEQLIQRFRKPITSTSANLTGHPTPSTFNDISQEIIENVDYVVNLEQNLTIQKKSSTIMKLSPNGAFHFIRK